MQNTIGQGSSKESLLQEIERQRLRLAEAEEALGAIRKGEVDALVVDTDQGEQIFTLQGAEHPYRVLVESMNEGAATLSLDGLVLYANPYLAALLHTRLENVMGLPLINFIAQEDCRLFSSLLDQALRENARAELTFICKDGLRLPVLLSMRPYQYAGLTGISLVATDLTEHYRTEEILSAEWMANSILDQAGDAIVVCDENGRIVRASQLALQIARHPLINKDFEVVFPIQVENQDAASGYFSVGATLRGESFKGVNALLTPAETDGHQPAANLLVSATPLRNLFGDLEILMVEQVLHGRRKFVP